MNPFAVLGALVGPFVKIVSVVAVVMLVLFIGWCTYCGWLRRADRA